MAAPIKSCIISLFLSLVVCSLCAQSITIPVLQKRGSLPNFSRAIKSSESSSDSLVIAFFGGSITEADNGWRDQSMNWLKGQYPKAKFKQINAAIGGTGSALGVYRLAEHVLKHQPDLVFVEYAVNDYKDSRKSILESIEGIVRQIWRANPKTDICFIYTFANGMLESYERDFVPHSATAIEEVANFYKIPSINFAPEIVKKLVNKEMFLQGKQNQKDSVFFSPDGVHPYSETGHSFYTQTFSREFPALLEKSRSYKHSLKKVYFSDVFENAGMTDVTANMIVNSDEKYIESAAVKKKFARLLPDFKTLSNEKQVLQLEFTGNKVGFLDIIGPESTQLKVQIDNEAPRYITRFDRFGTFSRMHWFFVENLSDGKHQIRISIAPNRINKADILDKKISDLNNPKQYGTEVWRVGKILLVNK